MGILEVADVCRPRGWCQKFASSVLLDSFREVSESIKIHTPEAENSLTSLEVNLDLELFIEFHRSKGEEMEIFKVFQCH